MHRSSAPLAQGRCTRWTGGFALSCHVLAEDGAPAALPVTVRAGALDLGSGAVPLVPVPLRALGAGTLVLTLEDGAIWSLRGETLILRETGFCRFEAECSHEPAETPAA